MVSSYAFSPLGLSLTIGLPGLTFLCHQLGWPILAGLMPPGAVHHAAATTEPVAWCVGAVGSALLMLVVARRTLADPTTKGGKRGETFRLDGPIE